MRKAGDILAEMFIEQFGPEFMETARASSDLFSSWEQVLAELWPQENPPPVTAYSRIKDLERGVLLVEADHPGWIQILQTKQTELLSAVKHRYPELEIRSISFRLSRR